MDLSELKLLELLQADEETGVIRFKHRRMLIFDADAMGLLRKELIETLGLERARVQVTSKFSAPCSWFWRYKCEPRFQLSRLLGPVGIWKCRCRTCSGAHTT